jgi:hypothetical protein
MPMLSFARPFSHTKQINFEKAHLLCKDLFATPCREMFVGGFARR